MATEKLHWNSEAALPSHMKVRKLRDVRFQLPFQPVNATHWPNGLGAFGGAPRFLEDRFKVSRRTPRAFIPTFRVSGRLTIHVTHQGGGGVVARLFITQYRVLH